MGGGYSTSQQVENGDLWEEIIAHHSKQKREKQTRQTKHSQQHKVFETDSYFNKTMKHGGVENNLHMHRPLPETNRA